MFNVIGFMQEISINPVLPGDASDVLALNQHHLSTIDTYQQLIDNWDEDGAIAPTRETVQFAIKIAQLLTDMGQSIYHTSPGSVGEIMINLANCTKSAELLAYPGGRNKFVRIGSDETPQQGALTPESLRETLRWLNR